MNPILDGPEKEKPVKKARAIQHKPEVEELLAVSAINLTDQDIINIIANTEESTPKAPIGQSNVYRTLAEWRDRMKDNFS